jgi:DNA (cytosine-5)-methyltransferase 1
MKNILDLFCGAGGFSLGFEKAGFNIHTAIDHEKAPIDTMSIHHHDTNCIIADLSCIDVPKFCFDNNIANIDGIIGGPPCQGFSLIGNAAVNDARNSLYLSYMKFVDHLKPEFFIIENVKNILIKGNGKYAKLIKNDIENLGYNLSVKCLISSDFGVPQNRERVFFVAHKSKFFNFEKMKKLSKTTVREALFDLPENELDFGSINSEEKIGIYNNFIRKNCELVYNHSTSVHTQKTIDFLKSIPENKSWKCLSPDKTAHIKFDASWRRIDGNGQSFTILATVSGIFHNKFNRQLTPRECARLMSFPDYYYFKGGATQQYRQIGNAVPPLLAYAIAVQIREQFKKRFTDAIRRLLMRLFTK